MANLKVYVAGSWEARERLYREKLALQERGCDAVSTWMDPGREDDNPTLSQLREYAERDLNELSTASLFILDTQDENKRGGREVEYGWALGVYKSTWIVGPIRNVFHRLADAYFKDWAHLYQAVGLAGSAESMMRSWD